MLKCNVQTVTVTCTSTMTCTKTIPFKVFPTLNSLWSSLLLIYFPGVLSGEFYVMQFFHVNGSFLFLENCAFSADHQPIFEYRSYLQVSGIQIRHHNLILEPMETCYAVLWIRLAHSVITLFTFLGTFTLCPMEP